VIYGLIGTSAEITGESIRDLIGRQFRVSIDDLRSRSRKRSVTFPRQMAMYLTRKYTNISLADIGNIYNRDHSTVLYAIKAITMDMSRQASVREQVEMLCAKLKK
jgi:chromosomal replication initiator protein